MLFFICVVLAFAVLFSFFELLRFHKDRAVAVEGYSLAFFVVISLLLFSLSRGDLS